MYLSRLFGQVNQSRIPTAPSPVSSAVMHCRCTITVRGGGRGRGRVRCGVEVTDMGTVPVAVAITGTVGLQELLHNLVAQIRVRVRVRVRVM